LEKRAPAWPLKSGERGCDGEVREKGVVMVRVRNTRLWVCQ
jgi:hypothetical protein